MQAGSKDRSSSTVALHVNSRIGCGLFRSWHVCQLQKICLDIWDCVESYAIPMFLAHGQKITFTSNPKLIISVLILILLLPSFKSLSFVASTRHAALNLACLLEVGQEAWCICSCNHDTQASSGFAHTPIFQNLTPTPLTGIIV
jgi:hypothetical protein